MVTLCGHKHVHTTLTYKQVLRSTIPRAEWSCELVSVALLSTKQISLPYTIPLWTPASPRPLTVVPDEVWARWSKMDIHSLKALYDYQGTKNELESHPAKCHRSIFKLASFLLSPQPLACGLYLLTCLSGKLIHSNWTRDNWLRFSFHTRDNRSRPDQLCQRNKGLWALSLT